MKRALTIAVRYCAVRRQFGPKNEPEYPSNKKTIYIVFLTLVIEYQTHQYRLLPFLAGSLSCYFFIKWLFDRCYDDFYGRKQGKEAKMSNDEIHSLSAGAKVKKLKS